MRRLKPARAAALAGIALAAGLAAPAASAAGEALVTVRQLAPETALKAAQAALLHCRAKGYSVGVAVVDRAGVPQAFVRDRFGGAHTFETALNKAWTAASFRMNTTELAEQTQAGRPMSAIRQLPRVAALGGGLPIEAAGAVVGAIGVSGAPGGDADEDCAKAGVDAILADIEL